MKSVLSYTLMLVMLSLAAGGDNNERLDQVQQEATAREAIAQTWQQYIELWEQGDALACAMFFTEDAINMPSINATQNGRAEVETFFTDILSSLTIKVLYQTTDEIFVHADIAYEFGTLEQELTPSEGDSRIQRFRYVSVFKRQLNGGWKFHRWLAQQ